MRWKRFGAVCAVVVLVIVVTVFVVKTSANGSDPKNTFGSLGVPSVDLPTVKLGRLNVHADTVTVSGFSAGASMATQLHIAHSSMFKGLAMFSQVFYRCSPANLFMFALRCSKYFPQWFPYPVERAVEDARNYEKQGLIDSLRNLETHKVFVWIGEQDEYIPPDLAKKNKDFYMYFLPEERISLVANPIAKHLFPTTNYGDACDADATENVYLGNCNYSGAYHALRFLLGEANVTENDGSFNESSLMLFDQQEFHPSGNIAEAAMGTVGFAYVPRSCVNATVPCHLHVNLHGCNEYPPEVALRYILHNEFLPIAEKNRIVVIFPLTTKVSSNMDGCWDFFSYTGGNFATKKGKQVQIIHAMVQRILHGKLNMSDYLVD